jgi:aminoglycoside phosphotransferase (APT) family kinase protein
MENFEAQISGVMTRAVGPKGSTERLARLSGGANMESWSFDYASESYVLRRAPSAAFMEGRAFGHDVEAKLVRAAYAASVLAPEIVAELTDSDGIGTGYVMRRIDGEVTPSKILADPPKSLIDDIAREMAAIHSIRPRDDIAIPLMDAAEALAALKGRFLEYGADRPIIALAIRWCEDNLPTPVPPELVHGDLRMGNILVGPDGLTGVLDWELAHWGDAHEDIAYGCMAVWRFGHFDCPAFGCASLEDYFAAYERHSGMKVDLARFQFWLVYRTLWWALGCLQMAQFWREGADSSLERPVIGRRTSENELDLLMLLEADAPEGERQKIAMPAHNPARRLGETSASELLEAVRDWIGNDVKARAEGREKFMAAVAMNALSMLIREQANPINPHDGALADALLSGAQSLATPGLLALLRALAMAKVANDSPKYASLAAARALWVADA